METLVCRTTRHFIGIDATLKNSIHCIITVYYKTSKVCIIKYIFCSYIANKHQQN